MSLLVNPSDNAVRVGRNTLVLCGLWFLYSAIGSLLHYFWFRLVIEGHIFNNIPGSLLARALNLLPYLCMAFVLGVPIHRLVVSPRHARWALAYAGYLAFLYLTSYSSSAPLELWEFTAHAVAAGTLAIVAYSGFLFGARPSASATLP